MFQSGRLQRKVVFSFWPKVHIMDYGLFCLNNRVPADGMAAPEEGFMKKIVIAGNSGSTENYAEALTRLGASCTVTTDCRL